MFNKNELTLLQNFCQYVIDKPRPIDAQWHVKENGSLWCEDWQIVEILKFYINGPEMYANDPPPNRLKKNNLWSKELIVDTASRILIKYKTVEAIIIFLQGVRNESTRDSSGITRDL